MPGEKPNFALEAVGESRQTIAARIPNEIVLAIHRQLDSEKQRARALSLPEPTLTWLLEKILARGLRAYQEELRKQPAPEKLFNK